MSQALALPTILKVAGTGLYVQMKNLRHRQVSVLPEVTQLRGDQAGCIYVPDFKAHVFFTVSQRCWVKSSKGLSRSLGAPVTSAPPAHYMRGTEKLWG